MTLAGALPEHQQGVQQRRAAVPTAAARHIGGTTKQQIAAGPCKVGGQAGRQAQAGARRRRGVLFSGQSHAPSQMSLASAAAARAVDALLVHASRAVHRPRPHGRHAQQRCRVVRAELHQLRKLLDTCSCTHMVLPSFIQFRLDCMYACAVRAGRELSSTESQRDDQGDCSGAPRSDPGVGLCAPSNHPPTHSLTHSLKQDSLTHAHACMNDGRISSFERSLNWFTSRQKIDDVCVSLFARSYAIYLSSNRTCLSCFFWLVCPPVAI